MTYFDILVIWIDEVGSEWGFMCAEGVREGKYTQLIVTMKIRPTPITSLLELPGTYFFVCKIILIIYSHTKKFGLGGCLVDEIWEGVSFCV